MKLHQLISLSTAAALALSTPVLADDINKKKSVQERYDTVLAKIAKVEAKIAEIEARMAIETDEKKLKKLQKALNRSQKILEKKLAKSDRRKPVEICKPNKNDDSFILITIPNKKVQKKLLKGFVLPSAYYEDADNDGFGNAEVQTIACTAPNGFVANADDQNDENDQITDVVAKTYCYDNDGDGYGDATQSQKSSFDLTANNYTTNCDDLDDNNELITDIPATEYFLDSDGDGFGDPNNSIEASEQPDGYVTNSNDIDDNDSDVGDTTAVVLEPLVVSDVVADSTTQIRFKLSGPFYPSNGSITSSVHNTTHSLMGPYSGEYYLTGNFYPGDTVTLVGTRVVYGANGPVNHPNQEVIITFPQVSPGGAPSGAPGGAPYGAPGSAPGGAPYSPPSSSPGSAPGGAPYSPPSGAPGGF